MTHDSLSAVKVKQTLYGAQRVALLGNKEHKWSFRVHVHVHMHMCSKRQQRQFYYQTCFHGGQTLCFLDLQWKENIPRTQFYTYHLPLPVLLFQQDILMISRIYTMKSTNIPLSLFTFYTPNYFPSMFWHLTVQSGANKQSKRSPGLCLS